MRRTAALALVALVALSGCSLVPGGGPVSTPAGSSTPTPSPTPTADGGGGNAGTATTDGTPAFDFPPGYGPGGVTDSEAALDAHSDGLLSGDSFVFRFNGTSFSNGSTVRVSVLQAANRSTDNAYVITEIDGFGSRTRYYDEETVYVRTDPPGENNTEYESSSVNYTLSAFTGRDAVGPLLRFVEYGNAERIERENGTFVRYRAERLNNVPAVLGDSVSAENVSDFRAAIVVDEDGVVQRLAYQATIEREETTLLIDLRLTVLGTGSTTVEDPDWIDRAR